MIPRQPGEPVAVRRQPRRRKEIVAAREHATGVAAAETDGDDGVDRLAPGGVILAHADPAIVAVIDHPVGEPPLPVTRRRLRRQRLRHGYVRRQTIETAVGEVGEDDGAVPHGPRAAAVFVHARARVE